MSDRTIWLRISYWAGAIGDFFIAVKVLIPSQMGVQSYFHPMGLLSAVVFSWGCMLIVADRRPKERRWVLAPTILVGCMLLLASLCSRHAGALPDGSFVSSFIVLPAVILLWIYSYAVTRESGRR